MEIKIVITKENKEQILKLIDQLIDAEAEGVKAQSPSRVVFGFPEASRNVETEKWPHIDMVEIAEPEIREARFGAWGMFNSFVPGKAALRVLITLVDRNDEKSVRLSSLIDACMTYFSRSKLYEYRGFPKKISESSRARLATHLIRPYYEMGLMRKCDDGKDPSIMITKEGLDFARMQNPLLDRNDRTTYLSEEEGKWMINHLKTLDEMGYKEFSLLRELTYFLSAKERNFEDIVKWFKENRAFVDWLRNGSRYENDPKAFSRQLENVARTFASGKIALLRELGVVSNERATYQVLKGLEA